VPVQEHADWPRAAVDWAEANGLPGAAPWRVFAPLDYGAYLVWRLPDRARDYADTRAAFFPPELLFDCDIITQLYPGWRERLERVLAAGTDYFLLEVTGPRSRLWQQLEPYAGRPLYQDRQAVWLTRAQLLDALARLDRAAPAQD
jgi:hypothetical protein